MSDTKDDDMTSIPSRDAVIDVPVTPRLAAILEEAQVRLRTKRYGVRDVLGFEHLLVCAKELSRLSQDDRAAIEVELRDRCPDDKWPVPTDDE